MIKCVLRSLVWLTLVFSTSLFAQTACPVGVAAGSNQCGPSPVWQPQVPKQEEPAPSGHYRDTWGAIAMDEVMGAVGTSVNMDSEAEAGAAAVRRCVRPGARGCAVRITYRNACGALAWSDNPGHAGGLGSARGLAYAESLARQECLNNGGGSCKIVFSQCTETKFVLF